MKRRKFMSLFGGAVASPVVARAQSPGKPRVGLGVGNPGNDDRNREKAIAALRDLGWIDGENVTIDERWRVEEIEDLVRLKPNVLFLAGPIRLQVGSRLTQTIPIVAHDFESDPIAGGYAHSLARPGRNITGVFLDLPELAGKQLQLLREVVPDLRRVGVLWDDRFGDVPFRAMETAARHEGISVQAVAVRDMPQIEPAIGRLVEGRPQALLVMTAPFISQPRVAELALLHRLPSMGGFTFFTSFGGLMAYGPEFDGTLRQAVGYVDRILKGAKPGDLPIERPAKFLLTINSKTAKALGLTVPTSILLRAEQVIE
jgi:putative ABC transport system substrate-binding protein